MKTSLVTSPPPWAEVLRQEQVHLLLLAAHRAGEADRPSPPRRWPGRRPGRVWSRSPISSWRRQPWRSARGIETGRSHRCSPRRGRSPCRRSRLAPWALASASSSAPVSSRTSHLGLVDALDEQTHAEAQRAVRCLWDERHRTCDRLLGLRAGFCFFVHDLFFRLGRRSCTSLTISCSL